MRTLLSSSFFKRFYISILIGMLCFFSILVISTQINSKKILDTDVQNTQLNSLQNIVSPLDQHFQDVSRTLSTLVINENVRLALSGNRQYAIDNFLPIVEELLLATRYSNKSITAIYLYSEYNKLFVTDTGYTILSSATDTSIDTDWMNMLSSNQNGISIFPYTSGNQIAGTFCITKEFDINGKPCIICVKTVVPLFSTIKALYHTNQCFYIISEDNNVLFSQTKDDSATALSISNHLTNSKPSVRQAVTIYRIGNQSWALAQIHSEKYPWSYVICNPLETYDTSVTMIYITTTLLGVVIICISLVLAFLITYYSSRPISNLRALLDTVNSDSETNEQDTDNINYIANQITQYVQTNQQLSDQLQKRLQLLHDTHLQALQFQINPHFMFNTLSMLNIMAENALGFEHEMPVYTKKLIKLLRYSLEPDYMVPLQQELQYNDIYLELLNQRYGNTINIYKNYDNNILNAQIPRLIIQPLIENAAFHGFSKKKGVNCAISIRCYFKKSDASNPSGTKYCVIEINDNGAGMDAKMLFQLRKAIKESSIHTGKNIGVKNVAQRLELSFPNEASLEITSEVGVGSCFIMTFPYIPSTMKVALEE